MLDRTVLMRYHVIQRRFALRAEERILQNAIVGAENLLKPNIRGWQKATKTKEMTEFKRISNDCRFTHMLDFILKPG